MKRESNQQQRGGNLSAFLAALGFAVFTAAVVLMLPWMNDACNAPSTRPDMVGSGARACLEFWAYRYQTLLTGAAALLAAWLASLPVRRQLNEMYRQSAAAARPLILDIARELEEEAEQLVMATSSIGDVDSLIEGYDHAGRWPDDYVLWDEKSLETFRKVDSYLSICVNTARKYPDPSPLSLARAEVIAALRNLSLALYNFHRVLEEQASGPQHKYGDKELTPDERVQRRDAVEAANSEWNVKAAELYMTLDSEISETWTKARMFERYAIGRSA